MWGAKAVIIWEKPFTFINKKNGSWSLLIDIIIIITIIIVIYMMLHNIKTQIYFIYDRFGITSFTK